MSIDDYLSHRASHRFSRLLRHALTLCLPLALLSGAVALAQNGADAASDAANSEAARAPVAEQATPSRGNVTVAGKRIDYTVTPGTLTIRNDEGEPIASMFYVGYVADSPANSRPRPVTFVFNGGPGSSSMWLHIGSFGPVRVDTPTDQSTPPAPFTIVKNSDSLIDKTDLVFIDMMGAGLSRPLGKATGKDFWGVDQDINLFADTIQRYLTINGRWNSPKFILGESYGTLRGAGLVHALQDRGVQMNGIILLSSILDYAITLPGNDQRHVTYLPSYAAVAWYHNRLHNRPATLEPFLTEVREFARGPYLAALAKGDDLPDAERDQIAQQLSRYTGLSVPFILQNRLRVELGRFRKELLRDTSRTVGRLDARFLGTDVDDSAASPEYDAANSAIGGAYIAAINHYLFDTLGYQTDLVYRPNFYRGISAAGGWDQGHRAPGGSWKMSAANTAIDLARAMRENPHLKVLALNGYYDMATPFYGAEHDLNHMKLPPELRRNITLTYYESGHMIYIHPDSMQALRRDLVEFYDSAVH